MKTEKKPELITFGRVLKKLRKERGFSQDDLSAYSRVDRSFISELETGEKSASFLTLISLCKALNIKPSDYLRIFENEYDNNK